jgi:hypothetical protein
MKSLKKRKSLLMMLKLRKRREEADALQNMVHLRENLACLVDRGLDQNP